jgi:hypothetical protein
MRIFGGYTCVEIFMISNTLEKCPNYHSSLFISVIAGRDRKGEGFVHYTYIKSCKVKGLCVQRAQYRSSMECFAPN